MNDPISYNQSFSVNYVRTRSTYKIRTRIDLGSDFLDDARFREYSIEASWAELERFSVIASQVLPLSLHLLPPAFRCKFLTKWLKSVSETQSKLLCEFLHIPRNIDVDSNRLFSRRICSQKQVTIE